MNEVLLDTQIPEAQRLKTISANLAEYEGLAKELHWITKTHALQAEEDRMRCFAAISHAVEMAFHRTKPKLGPLSPGCVICGDGGWSCLFINGKCNCRCFYCPTAQNEISVPTTNRIPFDKPLDYADYVKYFDFKGVSISGGEPLLTLDRTLKYLKAVRRKMGDDLHLWLYTNGTLLTREIVNQLKDEGLNEIRFDISAKDYSIERLEMAVGQIPVVTVEIPAIPEDMETVSNLLSVLHDAGVNHLNLHQLRLTPHNAENLTGRNYTFLHGDKVTVLESELMVLKLMETALARGVRLPINYCSYVYKHRFQGAAARKRNACFIRKDHESITEKGFIRTMALIGDASDMQQKAGQLAAQGADSRRYGLSGNKTCLYFHEQLWPLMDFSGGDLQLGYAEAILSPCVSYHHAFKEVRVNPAKKIVIERRTHAGSLLLNHEQQLVFERGVMCREPETMNSESFLNMPFSPFEFIPDGLQQYF
jgi:pyruvate formate-lyase activating enzyme-like uncharacterized protein